MFLLKTDRIIYHIRRKKTGSILSLPEVKEEEELIHQLAYATSAILLLPVQPAPCLSVGFFSGFCGLSPFNPFFLLSERLAGALHCRIMGGGKHKGKQGTGVKEGGEGEHRCSFSFSEKMRVGVI